MVEVENKVILKHQAGNPMNCTGEHNLQRVEGLIDLILHLHFLIIQNRLEFLIGHLKEKNYFQILKHEDAL